MANVNVSTLGSTICAFYGICIFLCLFQTQTKGGAQNSKENDPRKGCNANAIPLEKGDPCTTYTIPSKLNFV